MDLLFLIGLLLFACWLKAEQDASGIHPTMLDFLHFLWIPIGTCLKWIFYFLLICAAFNLVCFLCEYICWLIGEGIKKWRQRHPRGPAQ